MSGTDFVNTILGITNSTGGQSGQFLPALLDKYGDGKDAGLSAVKPENYLSMIQELNQLLGVQTQ
jgi:hypothetical protein